MLLFSYFCLFFSRQHLFFLLNVFYYNYNIDTLDLKRAYSFVYFYKCTFLGTLERRYVKKKISDDTTKTSDPQQDGHLLLDSQPVPTQDMPTLPTSTPVQPVNMPIITLKMEPEEDSMYW